MEYSGQADAAGSTKPPELVSAVERMKRLANSLADLGDQLNSQASRIFGAPPPEPQAPASVGPAIAKGDGAALLYQMADVFETIERNLGRVRTGANRLGDLG